jgi:hypothetical protein
MSSLNGILAELRLELSRLWGAELLDLYLLGSARSASESTVDADTVAVMSDATSQLEFARRVAPVITRHSRRSECLLTCFPVRRTEFEQNASQFIRNVHEFGIKL